MARRARIELTALVGAALLSACKPGSTSVVDSGPAPEAASVPPAPVALPEPSPSPPRAATAADLWFFQALSSDGTRALLSLSDGKRPSRIRLRVVDVDAGRVVEDADLEALSALPFETVADDGSTRANDVERRLRSKELQADLVRAAKILAPFPYGAAARIAASSDGKRVAFNAGDWLYAADHEGKVKRRLAREPSYRPKLSPDGRHVFFARRNGMLDAAVARYEIFAIPSDLSAAPRRIEGSVGARETFVTAADGRIVTIASHDPIVPTCVLAFAPKPPFSLEKRACVAAGGQMTGYVLSPHGAWAAVTVAHRTDEDDPRSSVGLPDGGWAPSKKLVFSVHAIDVAGGKVIDLPYAEGTGLLAISDEGRLVRAGGRGTIVDDLAAGTQQRSPVDRKLGFRGFFRKPAELVILSGDGVKVVDPAGP